MNQDCQSCYARIGDLQWLLYNEKKALMLCVKAFPRRRSGEKVERLTPHLNIDLKEFWFH
jgi:hypothetical protein